MLTSQVHLYADGALVLISLATALAMTARMLVTVAFMPKESARREGPVDTTIGENRL
jgi:hypothetical protein